MALETDLGRGRPTIGGGLDRLVEAILDGLRAKLAQGDKALVGNAEASECGDSNRRGGAA
jgi:hypothetical protein